MAKCVVCHKLEITGGNQTFHRFPTDTEKRNIWLSSLDVPEVAKSAKICSDHFNPKDYILTRHGIRMLKRDAVPIGPSLISDPSDGSSSSDESVENAFLTSETRLVMERKVVNVKEEIDIDNDFLWNMNIKQEPIDEVPMLQIQNKDEKINSIHPIKQEINDDSNTNEIFEERDIFKTQNIGNKLKYIKVNYYGRLPKLKGLLRNGKYMYAIAGIITCGFCGNLYTKQVEYFCHFSANHFIKRNKLYKIKFHHKNRNDTKSQIIDIGILRNIDVPDEVEVVEHELKAGVQEARYKSNVTGIERMKYFLKGSDSNRPLHTHTREEPFKCDSCFKYFLHNSDLNEHLLTHLEEKLYDCDICMKCFSDKSGLNKHLRTHSGEKPFKCNVCLKYFSQKCNLNVHLLIHTGEKPFKCDICMKTFTHKTSFITHSRIHTGEKPFKCDLCMKSFSQKICLTKHSRIHTG